jgi:hypothetical protein
MSSRRGLQKKLRTPEWQVSSFMMDRAPDHDIPYLAGYSPRGTADRRPWFGH